MIEYRELPPPPSLQEFVHRFWFLTGTPDSVEPQVIVPDGRAELVLHMREPYAEVDDEGHPSCQARALVAGQLLGPLRLAPSRNAEVIGIRFRTVGASTVLGGALSAIADSVVPLGDVSRTLETALMDAAAAGSTPVQRTESLAAALRRFAAPPASALARAAITQLAATSSPAISVGMLARRLGITERTLERHIRHEVGISPRDVRRVLRFRRAFALLDRLPHGRWTSVAMSVGYFDQPHMIRDFRRFAGSAPSEFFRRDPALARAFIGDDEGHLA